MHKESVLETLAYNKGDYYSRLSTSMVFGAILAYVGKITGDEFLTAAIPSMVPIIDFYKNSLYSPEEIYAFAKNKIILYSGYKFGVIGAHWDTILNAITGIKDLEKIIK